ncbi:fumarylacetoacetate hydrolase [Streptomyces sulfonofaciens]|uniref:Fumarylacetoacetate hydrolase n=1 Tax=Streptomyces sulfonofaciens TaxID=68272 RepID=A0A919L997_9ACTN|nr:fumarylacetoacetate hydrolase family protein [Streptomyces sulfonofaciens]GHH87431.1 fumarylacetoacetate hydrolase [Streptomyces sulfonofaciens]
MRIANLAGRLVILRDETAIDVEGASDHRFSADPQSIYERWEEFTDWAPTADASTTVRYDPRQLRAPVPRPAQVFAVGLNYADHARENGFTAPAEPSVFTKFRTSLTGPYATVALPGDTVDWEAELVVVIGRCAHRVPAEKAWSHVAGLTVGQDLSERTRQLIGSPAQFSIGKFFPGFAPTGPELVTPDELTDPDALEIGCSVNGEVVQSGSTSRLIFPVSVLIERLSAVLPLLPGDLLFTGTPSGVGHARDPQRYLTAGDVLETWVGGVGRLRNAFAAGQPAVGAAR